MKTRIHVNQHIIRANRRHGTDDPPITVRDYRQVRRGRDVVIHGESRLVYRPDKPLSCGARLWLETEAEVTLLDEKEEA